MSVRYRIKRRIKVYLVAAVGYLAVRQYMCVCRLAALYLPDIRDIGTIANLISGTSAARGQEFDGVVVPMELTAPYIKETAFFAAENVTQ